MVGCHEAIWALLYSDDGKLTGRTQYPERGLLLFLLTLVIVRLPLSWHKLKGGMQVEWIGYWVFDVGRFEMGVAASRVAWASRWLTDKANEESVRLGELREGLGRLQFLAGPVEYIRPFLGPIYAWASIGGRFAKPKLPTMILFIMKFIAKELQHGHMMPCAAPPRTLEKCSEWTPRRRETRSSLEDGASEERAAPRMRSGSPSH